MTRSFLDVAADIFDPDGAEQDWERWEPQPKQQQANEMARQVDELLFGGAVGGGKSEWGMEHVIAEMERYPGNRGGIFRRVFPSLERTILPRLKEKLVYSGRAKYNDNKHTFTFPNGSVIECASLQYADSVKEHQGAEYGVIFFEEITEFLQSQWEALIARLRAPVFGVRPHAIATTNPGGVGHRWVKRRWIKPKPEDYEGSRPEPYKPWRPKATDEQPRPLTRCFVPSTLEDNVALLRRDPGYVDRVVTTTDRGLRKAMRYGDWDAIDAVEGALWEQSWFDEGRVTGITVPIELRCVAVDPSDGEEDGDAFGVSLAARGRDGVGYVEMSMGWSQSPRRMAEGAIELYRETNANALVVERNHGGKWLSEVFYSVDPYVNVVETWASQGKRTRAEPVAVLFEPNRAMRQAMKFRARLVGNHPDLEEMCTTWTGAPGEPSPNELDAMVWALHWLLIDRTLVKRSTAKDERHRGRR